jgi:hypothetical protein
VLGRVQFLLDPNLFAALTNLLMSSESGGGLASDESTWWDVKRNERWR